MNRLYWLGAVVAIPLLAVAVYHHQDPWLFQIGTLLLMLICVVVNTFVIVYLSRSWRETIAGRAIMYAMCSLAALADLSLITSFLGPDWEWRGAARMFLFGGIFIAHTHMLIVLIMAPRRARQQAKKKEVKT